MGKLPENPDHVTTDYVAIPRNVLELHKYVTLVADGMFVDNTTFLIIMYPGIKFMTVEQIPISKDKQLSKKLKTTMKFYSRSRMIVQTILMDMELYSTKDELMRKIVDNTSAAKEHVTKIKRYIITANRDAGMWKVTCYSIACRS